MAHSDPKFGTQSNSIESTNVKSKDAESTNVQSNIKSVDTVSKTMAEINIMKCGYGCARCGIRHLGDAFTKYPPQVIKSLTDCILLCPSCHTETSSQKVIDIEAKIVALKVAMSVAEATVEKCANDIHCSKLELETHPDMLLADQRKCKTEAWDQVEKYLQTIAAQNNEAYTFWSKVLVKHVKPVLFGHRVFRYMYQHNYSFSYGHLHINVELLAALTHMREECHLSNTQVGMNVFSPRNVDLKTETNDERQKCLDSWMNKTDWKVTLPIHWILPMIMFRYNLFDRPTRSEYSHGNDNSDASDNE